MAGAAGSSPEQDDKEREDSGDGSESVDSDDDGLFIGGNDEPHERGPVMSDSSPEEKDGKQSPDSVTGLSKSNLAAPSKKRALGEVAKDEDELSIESLIDDNEDTSKLSPEELEQRLERL